MRALGSDAWRTGSHSPDQDTPSSPGVDSLADVLGGPCALPPTVTSLMARTCCSSALSLTTPDPTCVWQTSLAKNTVLRQTDQACRSLGQTAVINCPPPPSSQARLASRTELVTGQGSGLSLKPHSDCVSLVMAAQPALPCFCLLQFLTALGGGEGEFMLIKLRLRRDKGLTRLVQWWIPKPEPGCGGVGMNQRANLLEKTSFLFPLFKDRISLCSPG